MANFEVVLSDGRIIATNAGENTDLIYSLHDDSNNFVIVRRIDLRAFAQDPV